MDKIIEELLNGVLASPIIAAVITLSLKMYAGLARPNPPSALMEAMNNIFVRIFVWFLVLYIGSRNVLISATVSVAMTLGLDYLSAKEKNN